MNVKILAKAIIDARDALVLDDKDEAYHVLYMAAQSLSDDKLRPWKHVEALASSGHNDVGR